MTSGGVALPGHLWSLGLSSRALATYVSAMSWASDHDTDIVPDYAWRLLTEVRGHDLDAVKAELVDVHLLRPVSGGFRVCLPRPLLKVVSPSTG